MFLDKNRNFPQSWGGTLRHGQGQVHSDSERASLTQKGKPDLHPPKHSLQKQGALLQGSQVSMEAKLAG